MKLREYENRFPDRDISGAILFLEDWQDKFALRSFSGKSQALFTTVKDFPNGKIIVENIPVQDLLDMEVFGWAGCKVPLEDGDTVILTDGREGIVTHVKESDGSPFPIVTNLGQYKWKEIKMIKKRGKK